MNDDSTAGGLRRVVVGLSGGVDSAVAAYLLKRQGHEVVGIFMKNWEDDDRPGGGADGAADEAYCTSRQDFIDAASVADVLGIEIEHVNFAADYRERVFADFLREYAAGRTPNPDVLCNAEIKFKAFLDHAMRLGAEKIATGHYARVHRVAPDSGALPVWGDDESIAGALDGARLVSGVPGMGAEGHNSGEYQLLKGLDPLKDQSYFLHRLTQAQLSKTLFPVGELPKAEVRRIAHEIRLPVAAKKDSTGICFIGERPFREFLGRYLANQPGPVVDDRGRSVGEHVGLSFYTLGQRKGIGIGGLKDAERRGGGDHAPWFVARKDMARNTLVVVQGHDHPWLRSTTVTAGDASWVAGRPPATAGALTAKTRYRQADAACTLAWPPAPAGTKAAASGTDSFELHFSPADAQWAATPGQSAVLYDGEVCLGGGVIDATEDAGVDETVAALLHRGLMGAPGLATKRDHRLTRRR